MFDAIPGTKRNYIMRMPVLVIPFCEDKKFVYNWEECNKTYGMEVEIILRHERRIKSEKYLPLGET